MDPFSASIITKLGISVISSTIKCYKNDTLEETTLDSLDNIFGGLFGNICNKSYEDLTERLDSSVNIKSNSDVERCSRNAFLKALIAFSQAIKNDISNLNLTSEQQMDCISFIAVAQEKFASDIKNLPNLNDDDLSLTRNSTLSEDEINMILSESEESVKIINFKLQLSQIALREYNYREGNILHENLKIWLTSGLTSGKHWFIYYIHAFHGNLKKDKPEYCKSARIILTQKNLAKVLDTTRANFENITHIINLSNEIEASLIEANNKLDLIQNKNNSILKRVEELGVDLKEIKMKLSESNSNISFFSISLNERYKGLIVELNLCEEDVIFHLNEIEFLKTDIEPAEEIRYDKIQKRISHHQNAIYTIDKKRQKLRVELAEFTSSVIDISRKLAPNNSYESPILNEARKLFEVGDFEGANKVLDENIIEQMVADAVEVQDKANNMLKQAAHAYLTKASIVDANRNLNWLEDSLRLIYRAADTYCDYEIAAQCAYKLHIRRRFNEAISFYISALNFDISPENRAHTSNNIAGLYHVIPGKFQQALFYYNEAKRLYFDLSKNNGDYISKYVLILNNTGELLADNNKISEAIDFISEAFRIRDFLYKNDPNQYYLDYAESASSLGHCLSKDPLRSNEVEFYYDQAIATYKSYLEQDSSVLAKLATVYNFYLLHLIHYPSEFDRAKIFGELCLDIRMQLAKSDPWLFNNKLAAIYNDFAMLYVSHGVELLKSHKFYLKAIKIYELLYVENQDQYDYYLSNVLTNISILENNIIKVYPEVVISDNDIQLNPEYYLSSALTNIGKAIRIRREMCEKDKQKNIVHLANTLIISSTILIGSKDNVIAKQNLREALVIYRHLNKNEPSFFKKEICTTIVLYANYFALNEPKNPLAVTYFEKSLKIHDEFLKENYEMFIDLYLYAKISYAGYLMTLGSDSKDYSLSLAKESLPILEKRQQFSPLSAENLDSCHLIIEFWNGNDN